MKDILEIFIEGIKKKDHIAPILKGASVKIAFCTETKVSGMLIEDVDVDFLSTDELDSLDVEITGDESAIKSVILGQMKLREAINKNQLKISSSFRNLLFLETLFYLSKERV